jgi:lipoprotein-anchoring transpeptidase ErfK/SrfK
MCAVYRRLAAGIAALSFCFLSNLTISPVASAREVVPFNGAPAGTIVVRTGERKLYLSLGNGQAVRYPVGVGRVGRQWAGKSFIDGKHVRPDWSPPPDLRKPGMPSVIRGGTPQNPMGAAALTLHGGDYAIHGTNAPDSIGGFVSHGCIRMYNQDITDLYARVSIGTPVIVTR